VRMAGWKECLLGDVVNLKRGYDLPHNARSPGPFPVVSSSGITDHHSEAKVKGPGVVTGRYGTLGQVFFVESDYWPLNTSLYVQDFKGNDQRFVSYFLRTLNFGSQNAAGAVPGVNRNHLHAIEVRVPPFPIQQRIAGILSAYDELIENSQRRIKILESMARALYREWFVHFRFPGHDSPRPQAGEGPGVRADLVASALGEIPQGWEVKKLADFVTTKYGYTESSNTNPVGPKYLRGMDINKTSFIDWSEVPYCPITPEDFEAYRLRIGDVLVIRMADPGKVGIVEQDVDAVFASYLIRVSPKDERLTPYFLFYLMESAEYYAFITGASTGTTRKSASAGAIAEYKFVVPPPHLVHQFEDRVSEMRALLNALLKQTVNLRRTRDLLLPRLLSGQVNIEVN
jgi:type I restriction enzyme S subunit